MSADGDIIGAGDRWIPPGVYQSITSRVPIVCVDLLPIRGHEVGLIRRATLGDAEGWCLIGGAVLRNEPLDEAVGRHVRHTVPDLVLEPATLRQRLVAEYFTEPGIGRLVDPRKHAVAITYTGDCSGGTKVQGEAREFRWHPVNHLDELPIGFGQLSVIRQLLAPESD